MSDLIERLRTSWDVDRSIISQTENWMKERREAAAALAAKDAEIARLVEWNGQASVRAERAEDRAEKAEAEIARLKARREAEDMLLARAAYNAGQEDAERGVVAHDPRVVLSRARAALIGEKG